MPDELVNFIINFTSAIAYCQQFKMCGVCIASLVCKINVTSRREISCRLALCPAVTVTAPMHREDFEKCFILLILIVKKTSMNEN